MTMTTTTRISSLTCALLCAAFIALLSALDANATENTQLMERVGVGSERGECLIVDVSEESAVSEEEVDYMLLYAGFDSDPNDGREAVYSPDCNDGQAPYTVEISMKVVDSSESTPLSDDTTSEQGTYAEDGSYISNPSEYYGPAPVTSDDGWLVLVWPKGTTDICDVYINDSGKDLAQEIADIYIEDGYAATPVHFTKALDTKTPSCADIGRTLSEEPSEGPLASTSSKAPVSPSKGTQASSGTSNPTMQHAEEVKAESQRLLDATTQYAPKKKS